MKIGKPAEKPAPAAVTNGHASTNGAAHAAQARSGAVKPDASATIELSSTASTLLSSGSSAEFDVEKVSRISKAIEGGTFKINPEAIADKLISNAKEVLTQAKP